MVEAINSGDTEVITKLANTIGEVQAKRDEAASVVALWQIDFDNKMSEFVLAATGAIDDLDLSDEAKTAAIKTVSAYADAIYEHGAAAIANAKSIANQVQAALSSTNVTVPTNTTGYAEGTDYATPGPHLVGENGPEIVEFRGGEKVYTNEETERIMARSAAVRFFSASEGATAVQDEATSKKEESRKIIRLEINGGGAIEVNGAMDEATVLEILQAHLKPVLTSIVKQEIYEEGDMSYDF
jgi:SLT domain-containing protein